jgi:hypothetical protein
VSVFVAEPQRMRDEDIWWGRVRRAGLVQPERSQQEQRAAMLVGQP